MTESDIKNFLSLFPDSLMKLSKEEQQLTISLYRELAKGEPVSLSTLAHATNQSVDNVKTIIDGWGSEVHWDDDKNITGFFGLDLNRTAHQLEVGEQTLYTWCAWDTLFIPALINETVTIKSTCPVTHQEIRLEISPLGIQRVQPESTVVSLIAPDPDTIADNVTGTFCCHIHFFTSKEVGETWSDKNPGTYIVSLEDAYLLGTAKNKKRYPDIVFS